MTRLVDRWLRRAAYPGAYSEASYTGAEYAPGFDTGRGSARESSPPALVRQAREMHAANGIVFACQAVKQALFSEARFQYQKLTDGSTFGDTSLSLLEHPWPNSDSGELLSRMCLDGSLGNAFIRKAVPAGGGDPVLVQLRPESTVIISQELTDDMGRTWRQPVGYAEDMGPGREPQFYSTDEIAHFSPLPDPKARWRGMSWLTPILADVHSDSRLTAYKTWHIDNGAMPGLVVKYSVKLGQKTIDTLRKRFKARYGGPENAGNVLVLDEGADMAVAGSSLEQLQFDAVTKAGERRVCAAAGPGLLVIAGFEKGDYHQAIRELADLWARPHWRMLCASLEHLVPGAAANPDVPVRLWYDVSGIAALREGELQRAQSFLVKAQGLASAVAAGFTRESAVQAADTGDLAVLKADPNAPPPGTAARLTGKDSEAPGQPPTGGPAGSIAGRPPQAGRPQQLPGVGKPNLPNALPAGTAAMPALPAGARGNGRAGAKRSDDAWDGEWPFRGPDGLELDRAGFTEAEHPRIPGGHGGGQFTHSAAGGVPPPGVLPHPRDTMRGAPPALIAEMDKRLATAQVFTSGKHRGELKRPALPGYRRSVQQIRDEIMATIRAQGTLEQGRAWYPDERKRADARARAYGVRAEQAVGVMSATSPRTSYMNNQRVTNEILDAAPKMRDPSALARAGGGSMGQFRDQGLRIAMGEDPARVLHSPKQRSFFNNIMWPGQTADVTVDTWMQDAMARALGITHDQAAMLVSDKTKAFPDSVGYVLVADAVRDAAERMSAVTPGLTPDAVQAAYWIGRQQDAGLPNLSAHEGLTPRGRIGQAVGRADAFT